LRLQGYNYKLHYVRSEENISDYSSRHPHSEPDVESSNTTEEYVNLMAEHARPNAITLQDIKRETKNDQICKMLINLIKSNRWFTLDNNSELTEDEVIELKHYRKIREQLTVSKDNDIILKGARIVLPQCYHQIAINLAHVGHQGIHKTKALLRSKVYFRNIDNMVQSTIEKCIACQAVDTKTKQVPMKITPTPENVWDTINVDFIGPFPNGQYIFVAIDQRSRYPEIEFLKTTSANILIPCMSRIFAAYGNPSKVVSDNGPPFNSKAFQDYLNSRGIKHQRVTPLWPQANGTAERFMRPLKKVAQTAKIEQKDWQMEIYDFLFSYRNTPHSTTKVTPAEMIFNRKPNFYIPNATTNNVDRNIHEKAKQNDELRKQGNKEFADARRHAVDRQLQPGDRVLVRQAKINKLTPYYNPSPLIVIKTKGSMITAKYENNDTITTRNISYFKKLPPIPKPEEPLENHEIDNEQRHRKQYPKRERRRTSYY